MKTNEKFTPHLRSSLYLIVALILTSQAITSCQKDDVATSESKILLKTVSGNEISMDGIWSSGCVLANNNMILNETLSYNNKNLQIDIKAYDDMQCEGVSILSQTVTINFYSTGTVNVNFNGNQVLVNKIKGTANYSDGRVEDFKQIFFIDDSSNNLYMHHAIFENDGGQVNPEGYPIEIIAIPITKENQ